MSYGISVCPNCGGEVSVSEGYGGTCRSCGTWVTDGKTEESIKVQPKMEIVGYIVDCYYNQDDDRSGWWDRRFKTLGEASEYVKMLKEETKGMAYTEIRAIERKVEE